MNVVVISGGLGHDPELKSTQGGTPVLNFSVAVSDGRKNSQTGQWEDITHWIDVVMFGRRADSLSKILRKGMKVTVFGKLSQSKWEDKNGNKRSKVEVVANDVELPPRPKNGQTNNYTNQRQSGTQNGCQGFSDAYQQQPPMDVYDSDIPFGG